MHFSPNLRIDCSICMNLGGSMMGDDIDDLIFGSTETVPSER